nr:MAG TPA: hypothetical protein [Caudoviricetes sp.]
MKPYEPRGYSLVNPLYHAVQPLTTLEMRF